MALDSEPEHRLLDAGPSSLLSSTMAAREMDAERWTSRISETFVPLFARPIEGQPFFGELRTLSRGPLLVARIDGAAQEVRHGPQEIGAQREASVYFNLQLGGTGHVLSRHTAMQTSPGGGAIVPADEVFSLRFERQFRQLCVAMPADWFADRLGFPATALQQRHLDTGHGMGRVVRAAIQALIEASGAEEALLCGDLLARALADTARVARSGEIADVAPDVLLTAIRSLIRRRLADATLTPAKAAATLGCSLSTLHLRCQRGGVSFAVMLRDARLDAAANLLRSAPPRHGRIEAVSFACGFADPSHFARCFKARFGTTPSLYQLKATGLPI